MRQAFIFIVGLLILCICTPGIAQEKLLFSFEKEEVVKWAKFKSESDTAYVVRNLGGLAASAENATHGTWAGYRKHTDKWNSLRPGNKSTFYLYCRQGRVFRTLGWYDKVFPKDWSEYDVLRMDYKTDCPELNIRLEIEDAFLSYPVIRMFRVKGNGWVTLEVDLRKAEQEEYLDLSAVSHLMLLATERISGPKEFRSYLDNIRLVKKGTPNKLPIIHGGPKTRIDGKECAKEKKLEPFDISKTEKADGKVHYFTKQNKPGGYPLLYVNERCIGGFGDGGIILAPASNVYLSLDAGTTWTGLDGKGKYTKISNDHRGHHRSITNVVGTDLYMAYCTAHCGGGGARVTSKFTKAVRAGDWWITGEESVVDCTARYCVDRLALTRAKSGKMWCAWSHLNRHHLKDIRCRWTEDDKTWFHAGENARIGKNGCFHYPGTPGNFGGPYMTAYKNEAACFWRSMPNGDIVWTYAESMKVKVKDVKEGKIWLDAGFEKGLKIRGNILVQKNGKTAAVLDIIKLDKDSACAVENPGPAGVVKPGDEVTAMVWVPETIISKGTERSKTHNPRPHSVVTDSQGVLYVAITHDRKAWSKILRYDDKAKKWEEDMPAELKMKPMLSVWGTKVVCVWAGNGGIHLSIRNGKGEWTSAKKIADEDGSVDTLAVPQVSPEKFIPIAWSTTKRLFIKVVAVSLK
jgi:hypothetical protein